jgi:alpha-glucosidase
LRRSHAAPVQGTIKNIAAHGDVLTYERRYRNQRLFIALNTADEGAEVQVQSGAVLLSTMMSRRGQAVV